MNRRSFFSLALVPIPVAAAPAMKPLGWPSMQALARRIAHEHAVYHGGVTWVDALPEPLRSRVMNGSLDGSRASTAREYTYLGDGVYVGRDGDGVRYEMRHSP